MQKDSIEGLKRCTNIEILWYRKFVSLAVFASPEFREILLPRSLRKEVAS